MQFAEVVPNTKTDLKTQTFTYNIPPKVLPSIKIGSLVSIPFGKRKIEGLVFKITKSKGKILKEKLKPILNVLESEPILDQAHLDLAKWMAEYYLSPLSLCVFEMFALPPKISVRATEKQPKDDDLNPNLQPPTNYLSPILKLCQKVLSQKKQVIILFPETNTARLFLSPLLKKFKKVILYHGSMEKNERYQAFLKIKNGQFDIVLGSHLALFAPLPNLGLVVVVDEESESYKNDRSPRYNLKTVAEKLTQITKSKLVLLSSTPSLESYFKAKSKKFYLIQPKPSLSPSKTMIVDMKKEIQSGNYSPFSEFLQKALKKVENQNGQTILFINRRGAASYIFCRECGYVLRCPNCDTPLIYHLQQNRLVCHHCTFKMEAPSFCPNCKGLQIKFRGLGTQRIESEIKKMFTKPNILRIEKDLTPSLNLKPDFVIGTQKILSHWQKPVDLVAIISIDPFLNLPDFRQGEKVFSTITRLKSLSRKLFLLQTFHPENFIIQTALKNDYQGFYQKEIENRRKFSFPPFSKLIRLIHQSKNETKSKTEAEFLANKLEGMVEILGPSPGFYTKIRGKYQWQLLLKIPPSGSIPKTVVNLLKTLPSDWIIDVGPVTLL